MTTRRRVTITGTTGQLGGALLACAPESWDAQPVNRSDVDLADWATVRDLLARHTPDLVIHCAAATNVDACERDPRLAYEGNALVTRNLAQAAAALDAELVYISTNFVFDGEKETPYHEHDQPHPISVYGASKLAGENEARSATRRCFVVRTAMVFAPTGNNFVLTMRRLMRERDRLTVVADQRGNPTYAPDLARAIVRLVERAPYGVHHVTNAGDASWHEWAAEIARLDGATTAIDPIPASEYARAATPPANGVLMSMSLPSLGVTLPDWRDALRRCLAE